jgi:hypothetical protein
MKMQDKQFSEMMKDIRIDSPSSDFSLKVMSRIQAEAAVTRRPLLQNYQPVISKKMWIILTVSFVLLLIFISISGSNSSSANDTSWWSTLPYSLSKINSGEISIWKKGIGVFETIPALAYLIVLASLSLWTLDLLISSFRHNQAKTDVQN